MKKDVLKQIIKEVILEIKKSKTSTSKGKSLNENKESTVLGKDLKVGQVFMAKLHHPIVKLEPNKPTQGRILVYLKDRPQPINMRMDGAYGIHREYDTEKSLDENSPSPQRQSPDREVIEKPETDTPERKPRRRTLTPPTESPDTKPKAEGVGDIDLIPGEIYRYHGQITVGKDKGKTLFADVEYEKPYGKLFIFNIIDVRGPEDINFRKGKRLFTDQDGINKHISKSNLNESEGEIANKIASRFKKLKK